MLPHQEGSKVVGNFGKNGEDINEKHVMYEGVRCSVVNSSVNTITFTGSESNLDPSNLTIAVIDL